MAVGRCMKIRSRATGHHFPLQLCSHFYFAGANMRDSLGRADGDPILDI